MSANQPETIAYPCGCTVTKYSHGSVHKYCDKHNPYKNIAPRPKGLDMKGGHDE